MNYTITANGNYLYIKENDMKKTNKVKQTLAEMSKLSKYMKRLNEGIIFDDEEQMGPEMAPEAEGMPHGEHQEGEQGESEEEKEMHAQEVIRHEPIVGRIRETAIEGLKKYSDNPTSSLYEFFKDVFLSSDKLLTGKGK